MKKNLRALILLLLVCAIGATMVRGSRSEELRRDMERSLALLWEDSGQEVKLTGPENHLRADVRVSMGPGSPDWNFQLLRFVAQRHGSLRLESLTVRDRMTGLAMQEHPWSDSSASPHLEYRRRQLLHWLDQTVGAKNGLLLVDSGCLESGGQLEYQRAVLVVNGRLRGIEKVQELAWSKYPDLRLLVLP